jgi:hypothetical protein
MTQKILPNPFSPEAVVTYGQVMKSCEDFDYMRRASDELKQYLISYFDPEKQYGGAIGLKGIPGSGKTHLLNWLSQQAKSAEKSQPIVIYAKADGASFVDLYIQFFVVNPELSRENLQQLLKEAVKVLALEHVRRAKATESIGIRIEDSPQDLSQLEQEGNINRGQLLIELQKRLKHPDRVIPDVIPEMLTLMDDSSLSKNAYQWLKVKDATGADLKALGLSNYLLQLNLEQQGISAPEVAAVNALETIAALFRAAERPLIVLIDQLEVLLSDENRHQMLFSVLKKLIEQLNNQKALMFIAGDSQKSWGILLPDVKPRLRLREPLGVGHLKRDETQALLEAYTSDLPYQFSSDNISSIYALSGGSPREVIRTAYYAYEKVEGNLGNVDDSVLKESVQKSGTIAQRSQLALEMADSVLAQYDQKISINLDLGENVLLDRLLIADDRPRVALMILKATDKLSEIDYAKKLTIVRNYLEKKLASAPLIAVTVGYSSNEVNDLIKEAAITLSFDEKSFVNQLQTKITELLAQAPRQTSETATADAPVLELLERISRRLVAFEEKRTDEVTQIAERLAQKVSLNAAPIIKERELRTRWELVEVLSELNELCSENLPTLSSEIKEDPEQAIRASRIKLDKEQAIMKSILVANESYLNIKQIDFFGGLYIDILMEAKNLLMISTQEQSWNWDDKYFYRLRQGRIKIIKELSRILRREKIFLELIFESPFKYFLVLAVLSGLLIVFFVLNLRDFQLTPKTQLRIFLESIYIWFVCLFLAVFGVDSMRRYEIKKWKKILKRDSALISQNNNTASKIHME